MNKIKDNILKIIFIALSIIFTIPSIVYLINNKTVYGFKYYYKFLLNDSNALMQALIFVVLFGLISIFYLIIVKKQSKLFKNIKDALIFIAIISAVFMLVLPFTSTDIYYYMGTGTLESKYHQNPYYVSINDFAIENQEIVVNDKILQASLDSCLYQTIVYGPVWPLVCKILTSISMWNLDICLLVFKVFNFLLHILNCYIIYRITKKKKFVLLYGLNPFVLLEGIGNLHNDMLVITLVFTSIYLALKKKNILLSVVALAIATAIKYYTIMLLPFLIIYYFRKETPIIRLKQCFKYGLIFAGIIVCTYLLYFMDFSVATGMLTQQNKMAKSLFLLIYLYAKDYTDCFQLLLLLAFVVLYATVCIIMLNRTDIKFINIMKKYNVLLFIFLFVLITNFQPWYIMWLFPCMMWQKSKIIKEIIGISILSQLANSVFMIYSEAYIYGAVYSIIMILGIIVIYMSNAKIERKEDGRSNRGL